MENLLSRISNPQMRNATRSLLYIYRDKFNQPASISGKYHSNESVKEHSCEVAIIALLIANGHRLSQRWKDILLCAALLHDVGKLEYTSYLPVKRWKRYNHPNGNKYWVKFPEYIDHPEFAYNFIIKNPFPESEIVAELCLKHMGPWSSRHIPRPETFIENIIFVSDLLASRRGISVDMEVFKY